MVKICLIEPLPFSDVALARLKAVGSLTTYDTVPGSVETLIERLQGADVAIVGWSKITREILAACAQHSGAGRLKLISLWAAGSDYVDLDAARDFDVAVRVASGYAATAVAEFTIGAMLCLTRRIHESGIRLRSGANDWRMYQSRDMSAHTVGVIGCGAIAQEVIRYLNPFHPRILVHTQNPSPARASKLGVQFVPLDCLLAESTIVTVHIPLTNDTRHLLNASRLLMLQKGAILINTARGAVMDERYAIALLENQHLSGLALDVFENEPPVIPDRLFNVPGLILTPHIAFNTQEATARKTDLCITHVENFLNGST